MKFVFFLMSIFLNGACLTAEPSDYLRTLSDQELLKVIDDLVAHDQVQEAAELYRYFDCLLVDEHVIRHSNTVIQKLREQGIEVIGTTNPKRMPKDNELVIVYGNYHHAHNNLPYTNKIWRHPLYYQDVICDRFEYHPAWESIGVIYIINLKDRVDRYQESLSELCRMQAPLNRIHHYIAKKEAVTGDHFIDSHAGATKSHGNVTELFLNSPHLHCLVLEDDVTYTADIKGNLERLKLFFDRNYDYEVCLLNASKYHRIAEHDDLLLKSYQECTTCSAYLLSRQGAERALFYFRDGYQKLLQYRNTYYVCDRYWHEMQKDDKFFLFHTKFGYQRINYSSTTGLTECHFD